MKPTGRLTVVAGLFMFVLTGCLSPVQSPIVSHFQALRPVGATIADQAPGSGSVEEALRAVVQRANEAQQRAFNEHDPEAMRDTATDEHYQRLVQINRDLAAGGVGSIELVGLEWGPVSVDGSTARLTTLETWRTTLADGTTVEARERNDYTLVDQADAWKIQANEHPDDGTAATPPGQAVPAPRTPASPSADSAPSGAGRSGNWAGYAASGGTFTAVNGGWTIPQTPLTGSFGSSAAWVGIGGLGSRDLIQAGTSVLVSGGGQASYQAWVETLPSPARPVPLAVRPGDSVTVSIAEEAPSEWRITITNQTTGRSYSTAEQYTSSHRSAEWVQEAPNLNGRQAPLDDFGTVHFTGGSAVKDGRTVTMTEAGARPITMIDRAGRAIATPSGVGADGASFTVTRSTSAATEPTSRARGRRSGRFQAGGRSGSGG
ncbi:MAG TPA: G1 family glutamic endopeptidase [Chloroflexota bacterium]|jgi:hypothetical protein